MSMDINFNTYVVKYYRGVVDNVKFIYDRDCILSQHIWTFGYKGESPLTSEQATSWEQTAKTRIERLVNAALSHEAINEEGKEDIVR